QNRIEGSNPSRSATSAEGEGKGLDAGIEELDCERSVADRALLADQLIEPLLFHDAHAVRTDVDTGVGGWRLPIERHPEAHRPAARRPEDEAQVARVETEGDSRCRRHGSG